MRLILIAALLPIAASAAEPVPPKAATPAQGEAIEKLIAADTDGDGSWSKAEWVAAGRRERGFEMFDADRDGQLTRAELRVGLTRLRERRGR